MNLCLLRDLETESRRRHQAERAEDVQRREAVQSLEEEKMELLQQVKCTTPFSVANLTDWAFFYRFSALIRKSATNRTGSRCCKSSSRLQATNHPWQR